MTFFFERATLRIIAFDLKAIILVINFFKVQMTHVDQTQRLLKKIIYGIKSLLTTKLPGTFKFIAGNSTC